MLKGFSEQVRLELGDAKFENYLLPGVLRGADFGTFFGLFQQPDQGLHVVVVFRGFQDQLHSHSETFVHRLHHALHAQFQIWVRTTISTRVPTGKGVGIST